MSATVTLKGQCRKIFDVSIFHKPISLGALVNPCRPLEFLKICEDGNSTCTTGVNNTSGKLTTCVVNTGINFTSGHSVPEIYNDQGDAFAEGVSYTSGSVVLQ